MDPIDEKHLDQVASLFQRLGADRDASQVMAKQLLKRARQISRERNISELEALENLLKQVVEARQEQ
jgi:hypothetical protein